MAHIKLKKGYDLPLRGVVASTEVATASKSADYAIVPDDFVGLIPRMDCRVGDSVAAGAPLFHDKTFTSVVAVSPVAGTVKEVRRGERRKIEAVIIEPDGSDARVKHDIDAAKENPLPTLVASGLWPLLRQRPYDVVPNPDVRPRDIIVTAFDTAPLAPDLTIVAGEAMHFLAQGVAALRKLTDGNVYVCCRQGQELNIPGATVNTFAGPHPAGNPGVQLANISPINKGEVVWTLDVVTLARIGRLMATGVVDFSTIVAVVGESVANPRYVRATVGCRINTLADETRSDNVRLICGNVLTGMQVGPDGYLRTPYRQLTIIPELAHPDEFMGWASLSPKRFSIYRDFTSWLFGHRKASFDARIKGGERAIVRTDEYDRMLPMDIYAEFLIKAIITFDIEKMEQLGIYEVAPEDFALAEYACTSKLELQRIVRDGLNRLRAEME